LAIVVAKHQRVGLLLGQVEDKDRQDLLGIKRLPQVAVHDREAAVCLRPGEDCPRVADLCEDAFQGRTLGLWMRSPIPRVRNEVARSDAPEIDHAVADRRCWTRGFALLAFFATYLLKF
jgi:hypothetical protein